MNAPSITKIKDYRELNQADVKTTRIKVQYKKELNKMTFGITVEVIDKYSV